MSFASVVELSRNYVSVNTWVRLVRDGDRYDGDRMRMEIKLCEWDEN